MHASECDQNEVKCSIWIWVLSGCLLLYSPTLKQLCVHSTWRFFHFDRLSITPTATAASPNNKHKQIASKQVLQSRHGLVEHWSAAPFILILQHTVSNVQCQISNVTINNVTNIHCKHTTWLWSALTCSGHPTPGQSDSYFLLMSPRAAYPIPMTRAAVTKKGLSIIISCTVTKCNNMYIIYV